MTEIRRLTPRDVEAADLVAGASLDRPSTDWHRARMRHLLQTDPEGAWVAEDEEGVAGTALSLVREGIWGLSLLGVADRARGTGTGRALLHAAHRTAAGCRGRLVLASQHPAALRSYAGLGLDLHPVVDAAGIADLSRAPDAAARVTDGDPALADAIGREVRGAGHRPDIDFALTVGSRLLTFEDRAFVLGNLDEGIVTMAAGRDEEAAAIAVWGALARVRRGATVQLDFLDARNQWAIRVALDARLALTPGGAVFQAGDLGPMTPYVPSGPWL